MTHLRAYLNADSQRDYLDDIGRILAQAPLFWPTMPGTGKPFSVRMSNCGALGWVSDRAGYRYQKTHPETGKPWPGIPEPWLRLWRTVSAYPHPPECCLINFYGPGAKMGLHQDSDEAATDAPVVSVSLGDSARFRLGGTTRRGATRSFMLESGDVFILGGPDRMAYHGIDRIYPGSSDLVGSSWLAGAGRINLTMRKVT